MVELNSVRKFSRSARFWIFRIRSFCAKNGFVLIAIVLFAYTIFGEVFGYNAAELLGYCLAVIFWFSMKFIAPVVTFISFWFLVIYFPAFVVAGVFKYDRSAATHRSHSSILLFSTTIIALQVAQSVEGTGEVLDWLGAPRASVFLDGALGILLAFSSLMYIYNLSIDGMLYSANEEKRKDEKTMSEGWVKIAKYVFIEMSVGWFAFAIYALLPFVMIYISLERVGDSSLSIFSSFLFAASDQSAITAFIEDSRPAFELAFWPLLEMFEGMSQAASHQEN